MFEKKPEYPCAISDFSEEGCIAAFRWCCSHLQGNQFLTLWTPQKRTLRSNLFLESVASDRRVKSTTPRDGIYRADGPVLAMYPHPDDLGSVVDGTGITALAMVTWAYPLDTWARETKSEVLVPPSFDDETRAAHRLTVEEPMDSEVVDGLEQITKVINHNNTIAARGFEKSRVIEVLLRLHDAGLNLPPTQMMEWAAANGWRGDNVKELGRYAQAINGGKRPRQ